MILMTMFVHRTRNDSILLCVDSMPQLFRNVIEPRGAALNLNVLVTKFVHHRSLIWPTQTLFMISLAELYP